MKIKEKSRHRVNNEGVGNVRIWKEQETKLRIVEDTSSVEVKLKSRDEGKKEQGIGKGAAADYE